MEDVLEELVGEIEDEYDLPDARLVRVDDGTVLVAGSMTDRRLQRGDRDRAPAPRARARSRAWSSSASAASPSPADEVELAGVRLFAELSSALTAP